MSQENKQLTALERLHGLAERMEQAAQRMSERTERLNALSEENERNLMLQRNRTQ